MSDDKGIPVGNIALVRISKLAQELGINYIDLAFFLGIVLSSQFEYEDLLKSAKRVMPYHNEIREQFKIPDGETFVERAIKLDKTKNE